jgi:hypothetical protein
VKCPPGERATAETKWHCCWPGQTWHPTQFICAGTPTACPKGREARGDNCLVVEAPVAIAKPEEKKDKVELTAHEEKQVAEMVGHGEAAAALPAKLENRDIVGTMVSLGPKVHDCATQHGGAGTAMMGIVVTGEDGKVTSATVTGSLAGTPTGDCVVRVVRATPFKRFKLKQQAIAYPLTVK